MSNNLYVFDIIDTTCEDKLQNTTGWIEVHPVVFSFHIRAACFLFIVTMSVDLFLYVLTFKERKEIK